MLSSVGENWYPWHQIWVFFSGTHSFTHSPMAPNMGFFQARTYSLTHSPMAPNMGFFQARTHSLTHSLTHGTKYGFFEARTHSLTHSLTHPVDSHTTIKCIMCGTKRHCHIPTPCPKLKARRPKIIYTRM
jgi:hypothetical protein